MANTKQIVHKELGLDLTPADTPPTEVKRRKTRKVYRFKKIGFPAQPVRLDGLEPVFFKPIKVGGAFQTVGEFSTEDEKLAGRLKKAPDRWRVKFDGIDEIPEEEE